MVSYFVIEKKIKDIWEDWIVFNSDVQLEEVLNVFGSKDKEHHRIVKRTDKVLHVI